MVGQVALAGGPIEPALDGSVPPNVAEEEAACEHLLQAAHQLIDRIHLREEEFRRLLQVTQNINRGLDLGEVLEFLYQEFRAVIPFNRLGCALIDEKSGQVVAHWARSDRPVCLGQGFQAPLEGSTLADIVRTGRPRIIGDLAAYLRRKPQSTSTNLVVREGMRSSLTCPLVVRGRPVGFLFFSSERPEAYSQAHVAFFQQIASQLSLIVEKGRLYSEMAQQAALIERQNRQLLEQLDLARQFQRGMIPSEKLQLPGMELAFDYQPAILVGGDILEVMPLPEQRALVFVGDAVGHGVEAAMVMAAAKTALLTAVHSSTDPADLLRQINEELHQMLLGERFVTAVCGLLDPVRGRADLALAGHANPLHISAASGEISRPGEAGIPLGLRPGECFTTRSCNFAPGDTLVFFTDGVVEARNAQGQFYSDERLLNLVRRQRSPVPRELLRALVDDLQRHCQERCQDDDRTILVVQSTPSHGDRPQKE